MINLNEPVEVDLKSLIRLIKNNYPDITKGQIDYLLKDVEDSKIKYRFYKLIE